MYYDLLPKIKNAGLAKKEVFLTPYSKSDLTVLKILSENKFIKDVKKKTIGKKSFLEVKVAYHNDDHITSDFKIISKPSRHVYLGYRSVYPVKQGHGLGVISTPKGIMTDKEARKNKLGGEYLFQIW